MASMKVLSRLAAELVLAVGRGVRAAAVGEWLVVRVAKPVRVASPARVAKQARVVMVASRRLRAPVVDPAQLVRAANPRRVALVMQLMAAPVA